MEEAEKEDIGSEAEMSVDDTDIVADTDTSSVNVAGKGKRKIQDEGAETRKKKLLCKRSAERKLTLDPETKSFIEVLIHTSVTFLGDRLSAQMEKMENGFTERMGKMESEVSQLREVINLTGEGRKANQSPSKSKFDQPPATKKYNSFLACKRKYTLHSLLLEFGKWVLPPHGRTQEIWNVDVDRLYVPVHVSGNHWIALCISFMTRSIDVFDCSGRKRYKEVDAFAHLVPRIVKAVQPTRDQKEFTVGAYTVFYVPVRKLNKSACDCGVYAVKFIECHSLGLELSLVNDDNIKEARHRILWDLWEAANDPELVDRMSTYEPPECLSSTVEEIL
ncbi:hypothetical protein N665_1182s0002 [Sinapis alba]|nr:hypothetical protein N665_1182s0002 [Sinapis alba]